MSVPQIAPRLNCVYPWANMPISTHKLALKINPTLEITAVAVTEQHACVVVDDFLLNPDEVVAYASARAADFTMPERAYPGVVLPVANNVMAPLNRFIQTEMSRLFSFCRGGIEFHTQLSMTTLQPRDFSWIQRLCHTDPKLADDRRNYAALLYLFHDPALGGTGFFHPRHSEQDIALLVHDSSTLDRAAFDARRPGIAQDFMRASNHWFERIGGVAAAWNRMIFYDGRLFHSGEIGPPERMVPDPRTGRLTLNGFFTCSRAAR